MPIADDEHRNIAVSFPVWSTLVIDLPLDQRKDAAISIDNESLLVDETTAKLEFRLKPGQHSIRITRPNYQPIEQVAMLTAGALTISPKWQPLTTTGDPATIKPLGTDAGNTPDKPAPGADPADVATAKKIAPPSPADQERIAKELDDVYKLAHSPAKDRAMIAEMFKTADEPGSSPAERYMLLTKGVALAAGLGDFEAAFQGIDTLDAVYEIDLFGMKQKLLDESVAMLKTSDQITAFVAAAEQLINQAVAADQYDTALAVVTTAKKGIAKRPADFRLFKEADERLAHRRGETVALQGAHAGVEEAQKTLAKRPGDPAANLTLGRWYCLLKNDWQRGLPLLAKSGDDRFQPLAKQELAGNLDTKSQLQIADGWWDAAGKETDLARDNARLHASEIYQIVLPNLESPLKKIAIEQRLADVVTSKSHGSAGLPAGGRQFSRGQWVDLLRLANPVTHAVFGKWTRQGTSVICQADDFARLQLPVEVNGGYDLEVEFTRKQGNDDVNVIIPVGSRYSLVMLGGFGGRGSGLHKLAGGSPADQANQYAIRPGNLQNGRRYRLLISVRALEDDSASIAVNVDGRPAWPEWQGPVATLDELYVWRLSSTHRIGIGAYDNQVAFHSVRFRLVSGDATTPKGKVVNPTTIVMKKAAWGGGNSWSDVIEHARYSLRNNEWIWATFDFFGADPLPGSRKRLELTYEKSGKEEHDSVDEHGAWKPAEHF